MAHDTDTNLESLLVERAKRLADEIRTGIVALAYAPDDASDEQPFRATARIKRVTGSSKKKTTEARDVHGWGASISDASTALMDEIESWCSAGWELD